MNNTFSWQTTPATTGWGRSIGSVYSDNLYDNVIDRFIRFKNEDEADEFDAMKNVPIDSVWDKPRLWISLSQEPALCKLEVNGVEHMYVLTPNGIYSGNMFFAMLAVKKWGGRLSPSVKTALYHSAMDSNIVSKYYGIVVDDNKEKTVMGWWEDTNSKMAKSVREWLDDTSDSDLARFCDPINTRYVATVNDKSRRSDDYRSSQANIALEGQLMSDIDYSDLKKIIDKAGPAGRRRLPW